MSISGGIEQVEQAEQVAAQAERAAAGPAGELLERLVRRLGGVASVSAVFGQPVQEAGVTVIPVSRAMLGAGAGSGRRAVGADSGEGGGGGVVALPVGFIEIRDGRAAFHRIRGPFAPWVAPAVLTALAGVRLVRRRR
jgi:hypothetical protein